MLVRAYDTATGTLAWQDQAPLASGIITGVFIDDLGHKVFAAGYFGTDFLVRAYDARTGCGKQRAAMTSFKPLQLVPMEFTLLGTAAMLAQPRWVFWCVPTTRRAEHSFGKIKLIREAMTLPGELPTQGQIVFVAGSTSSSPARAALQSGRLQLAESVSGRR
jgi:hypothetical protein